MPLRWIAENGRVLGMCGDAPIGAIFPSSAQHTRWRVWVTKNMNPVEGAARSFNLAKVEVEKRFDEFLKLAKLTSIQ